MKLPVQQTDNPELDVAPLIDMVFLLLVYFLMTASLVKSEGDLGIRLPGALAQAQAVDMPDEQIVDVSREGRVYLNGREFDSATSSELPELSAMLQRYRQASTMNRTDATITVAADDETKHQRVIDVMNACASAGIKNVTFATSN